MTDLLLTLNNLASLILLNIVFVNSCSPQRRSFFRAARFLLQYMKVLFIMDDEVIPQAIIISMPSSILIGDGCRHTRRSTIGFCRDPSPWETRGTQLIVTCGTCYQPDHHHPDSPKDMHGVVILSEIGRAHV